MRIKKFRDDVKLPTKSHATDVGYDMYLPDDFYVCPFSTKCVGLGIGFEVPVGYAGIFVPRSSIAKKGFIIQTSIVDPGYTGETHLILTNPNKFGYDFKKGDRLCSIVFFKVDTPEFEVVDEFEKSERGENGLGSTGN